MDLDNLDGIVEVFPRLKTEGFSKTSEINFNQNCIGFALGTIKWWEHGLGSTWLRGIPDDTIPGWIELFRSNGFIETDSASLEEGIEKIAIYANVPEPTHVALQLENGAWRSKLGWGVDIEHVSHESLKSDDFGDVVQIMKKLRASGGIH